MLFDIDIQFMFTSGYVRSIVVIKSRGGKFNMALNRFYVISPLALVAVSACRSPHSAGTPVSGTIVKGPLSNALVFFGFGWRQCFGR